MNKEYTLWRSIRKLPKLRIPPGRLWYLDADQKKEKDPQEKRASDSDEKPPSENPDHA